MNLADVVAGADPEMELAPNQAVVFGGKVTLMTACLDRTGVLLVNSEKVLIRHALIDIPDPALLRWQRRPPASMAAHISRRRGQERTRGAGPR